MTTSGVSLSDSLASLASNLKSTKIQGKIATAILKQIQDQQGAGRLIDNSA